MSALLEYSGGFATMSAIDGCGSVDCPTSNFRFAADQSLGIVNFDGDLSTVDMNKFHI
jgi:hypothetical protein